MSERRSTLPDFRILTPRGRLELVDALRGLSILLMVAYHVGYDLYLMEIVPQSLLFGPLLTILQPFFAGVFILLSGMSSRFSQNNIKRGGQTLGCAFLVSLVSGIFGMTIWFGILHCLGLMMILHELWHRGIWPKKWKKIHMPLWASMLIWGALFAISFLLLPQYTRLFDRVPYMYVLGFIPSTWHSVADYFPLVPWIFLYGFGHELGKLVTRGRMPLWFYQIKIPLLPIVGRHTLLIYMLHQPVVLLVLYFVLGGRTI